MKIMDFTLHTLVATKALPQSFLTSSIIEPFCGVAGPNTEKDKYAITECRVCYRMSHFLLSTKVVLITLTIIIPNY